MAYRDWDRDWSGGWEVLPPRPTPPPNPNLRALPFVDGWPLPASSLDRLFRQIFVALGIDDRAFVPGPYQPLLRIPADPPANPTTSALVRLRSQSANIFRCQSRAKYIQDLLSAFAVASSIKTMSITILNLKSGMGQGPVLRPNHDARGGWLRRANTLGRVAWCVGSSPAPKRPAANRPGWAVA